MSDDLDVLMAETKKLKEELSVCSKCNLKASFKFD